MERLGDQRVLVVGLDGATLDLIQPMIENGKLPNLSRMISQGNYDRLFSTIPPLSPPAWTTFSTGKNPGKHGVYDFSKRKEQSYSFVPTTSLDIQGKTLWDIIGYRGGKSIIVNVPLTYPPKPLDGVMISGFPTPPNRTDYTYPESLLSDLTERFGQVDIRKPPVMYRKGREKELTEEMIRITKQQTEITKFLMHEYPWNLTVSVYDATDIVGHYFWAYLDRNHPKYNADLADLVRELVNDVHASLDDAIGTLAEAAGNEALKLVISDHGFGPVYYGVYVNNWLLNDGYMQLKGSASVRAKYFAYRHGFHLYNFLQVAKKLHLVESIESAYSTKSRLMGILKAVALSFDDIDWAKTKVYAAGNFGQLYLNLKGREPQGIVNPKDARHLIEDLAAKLRELRDPNTGMRMFDHIYLVCDAFNGAYDAEAPDLIFLDGQMIYAAHRFFELGSNKLVTLHPLYSGHHKIDGLMFLTGEGVRHFEGRAQAHPNLVDIAPTILHYLGIPLPQDMDGRVLVELFEANSNFAKQPVHRESAEREKIQQSLKGLGALRAL